MMIISILCNYSNISYHHLVAHVWPSWINKLLQKEIKLV